MAKFAINACQAIWWPNWNQSEWRHPVAKSINQWDNLMHTLNSLGRFCLCKFFQSTTNACTTTLPWTQKHWWVILIYRYPYANLLDITWWSELHKQTILKYNSLPIRLTIWISGVGSSTESNLPWSRRWCIYVQRLIRLEDLVQTVLEVSVAKTHGMKNESNVGDSAF